MQNIIYRTNIQGNGFLKTRLQFIITLAASLLLSLLLRLPMGGEAFTGSPAGESYLDLSRADTVRVSILGNENPGVLRINAVDDMIRFRTASGDSALLGPGDGFAFLYLQQGKMMLRKGDLVLETPTLSFSNSGGLTQVFAQGAGNRLYHGDFEILFDERQNKHLIINSVPLEDYVASVIGAEMNFREPEALKTQAVVSRTYALWSIHRSPYAQFDLRDDEQNQVYRGVFPVRPDYAEAAAATSGEILTWSNRLILAAFSSTCGGATSHNEDVWSGDPLPYLRSSGDGGACSVSPHFRWSLQVPESELSELISSRYGYRFSDMELDYDTAGRVRSVVFTNGTGRSLRFEGNEFRTILNRYSDTIRLRSTRFRVERDNGTITFTGNGLGHGVGLCQWGAKGFAEAGWSYRDILSFYFTGAKIVDLNTIESKQIALSG